jgi:hypothetical protein
VTIEACGHSKKEPILTDLEIHMFIRRWFRWLIILAAGWYGGMLLVFLVKPATVSSIMLLLPVFILPITAVVLTSLKKS